MPKMPKPRAVKSTDRTQIDVEVNLTDSGPDITDKNDSLIYVRCQNLGYEERTQYESFHAHHIRLAQPSNVMSGLQSMFRNCYCNKRSEICAEYECVEPVHCYMQGEMDWGCVSFSKMPEGEKKLADIARNMAFAAKRMYNPQEFYGKQTVPIFQVCIPIRFESSSKMENMYRELAQSIKCFVTSLVAGGNIVNTPQTQKDNKLPLPVVLGMCANFGVGTSLITARNLLQGIWGTLWDMGIHLYVTLALVPVGRDNRIMLRCTSKSRERHGQHYSICQMCFHQTPRENCPPAKDECPVCKYKLEGYEPASGGGEGARAVFPEPVRALPQSLSPGMSTSWSTPHAPRPHVPLPQHPSHSQPQQSQRPLYAEVASEEGSHGPHDSNGTSAAQMTVLGTVHPQWGHQRVAAATDQNKDQQISADVLSDIAERLSKLEFDHPKHCCASLMTEGLQLWESKINSLDRHREECERFRSDCNRIQLFNPTPQKRLEASAKIFQSQLEEVKGELLESMRKWEIKMERGAAAVYEQIPRPAFIPPKGQLASQSDRCRFCKHCRLKEKRQKRRGREVVKGADPAQSQPPIVTIDSPASPTAEQPPITGVAEVAEQTQAFWRLSKRSKSESELKN